MRSALIAIIILVSAVPGKAQDRVFDSLRHAVSQSRHDTAKVLALLNLANHLEFTNPDKGRNYLNRALALSKKTRYENGKGRSYLGLAYFSEDASNYRGSLYYYKLALASFKKCRSNQGTSSALLGMSACYLSQGNHSKALKFALYALRVEEKANDPEGLSAVNSRIGMIYFEQGNYTTAFPYFRKQLDYARKTGKQKKISAALCNVGNVYTKQKRYTRALELYRQSLDIDIKMQNHTGMATQYNNIATVFEAMADSAMAKGNRALYEKHVLSASGYYDHAIEAVSKTANVQGHIFYTTNKANLLIYTGRLREAKEKLLKCLDLATKIHQVVELMHVHDALCNLYGSMGDHKKQLAEMKLYALYKDSVFSAKKNDELVRHQLNYEFEKKEAAIHARNRKITAQAQEAQKKQGLILILVTVLAFSAVVIAGVIFRSLKTVRKQKVIIEKQKLLVETKQNEIIDSIRYAGRIQKALLPSINYIKNEMKKFNESK
ncbi:MAG TPA: tetratricopeptide repeat protein [Flavobacteriales bacterium]|nr:tetratricopeptide repeat protein [Flavobacteriales bacterium]